MGLFQAANAWHSRRAAWMPWKKVRLLVHTASGALPGLGALEDAVARVDMQRHTDAFKKSGAATSGSASCGRAPLLMGALQGSMAAHQNV